MNLKQAAADEKEALLAKHRQSTEALQEQAAAALAEARAAAAAAAEEAATRWVGMVGTAGIGCGAGWVVGRGSHEAEWAERDGATPPASQQCVYCMCTRMQCNAAGDVLLTNMQHCRPTRIPTELTLLPPFQTAGTASWRPSTGSCARPGTRGRRGTRTWRSSRSCARTASSSRSWWVCVYTGCSVRLVYLCVWRCALEVLASASS